MKESFLNSDDVIKFRIEELFGEYFENRNSFYTECPYCGKSKKFYIQKRFKYFICFKCEEKGSIYRLVAKLKNISVKEAFKLIHHIKKENLSYNEEFRLKFIEDVYDDESSGAEYADLSFFSRVNNDEEALAYLRGRGLDDKMIEYFDIHYSAGAKRVIFPVYFEDKVVGYQARDITGNQEPKVMSSKGFQKSKFLYNYNQLLYELPDYAVITEGPIDCIKSYKHNSVALFGKELSQDQLNLLLKIPTLKKVYIAIDPEEKDVRAKMMRDLSAFWETMLVPVEAGRDIGDCSLWEVDMLMKNSKSVFDFDDRISII